MFQTGLKYGSARKVEFSYEREARKTHCTILDESDNVVSHGVAKCSVKDQFNKNTGRKVALTHALELFGKWERGQVWNAYFQARNGKKD